MTDPQPFPAVDDLVLELLADLVADGHAGTVTPADLADVLPYIRVTVHGGKDDGVTDHARIDVDTFDATYAGARTLAEQVRQRLSTRRAPHVLTGGVIDRAVTLNRPQEVLWADNGELRRVTAAYTVDTRRNPA